MNNIVRTSQNTFRSPVLLNAPNDIGSPIKSSYSFNIPSEAVSNNVSNNVSNTMSDTTSHISSNIPTSFSQLKNTLISSTTSNESSSLNIYTIFKYIVICLIIFYLIINLGNIKELIINTLTSTFNTILTFFGITIAESVKTAKDVGTIGLTASSNIVNTTIDHATHIVDSTASNIHNNINKENKYNTISADEPIPDNDGSLIQANSSSKKSGWCFVGQQNGFRSCVKITDADKCMSGNIFPSRDICINPTLRE
jgi:hypothetical protein